MSKPKDEQNHERENIKNSEKSKTKEENVSRRTQGEGGRGTHAVCVAVDVLFRQLLSELDVLFVDSLLHDTRLPLVLQLPSDVILLLFQLQTSSSDVT